MSAARCPFDDPLAPDFVADPYPALGQARKDAPVHYLPTLGMWLVTRYADVQAVLKDTATFTNANVQQPLFPFAPEVVALLNQRNFEPGPALTGSDGALHKRLRQTVAKALAFTPKGMADAARLIGTEASHMVGNLPRSAPLDLVTELTSQFPARIIFRLIGFPANMNDKLLSWCMDRLRMFWGHSSVEEQLAIADGLASYWSYCEQFVAESLEQPGNDIAGNLIRLRRDNPDDLSLREIAGILFGLVFAGQETTANALAQMLWFLLEDRSRWERLIENRSLIDAAFSETLRLAPPIAGWRRYVARDAVIGGQPIRAGAHLLIHLGSTGHDQAKFAGADVFDLHRRDGGAHLAFGHGAHFCLGAPLAKLEARGMLEALLTLEPNLALVPDQRVDYVRNIAFRGPTSLLVERL